MLLGEILQCVLYGRTWYGEWSWRLWVTARTDEHPKLFMLMDFIMVEEKARSLSTTERTYLGSKNIRTAATDVTSPSRKRMTYHPDFNVRASVKAQPERMRESPPIYRVRNESINKTQERCRNNYRETKSEKQTTTSDHNLIPASKNDWVKHVLQSHGAVLSKWKTKYNRWLWNKWSIDGPLLWGNAFNTNRILWIDEIIYQMRLQHGTAKVPGIQIHVPNSDTAIAAATATAKKSTQQTMPSKPTSIPMSNTTKYHILPTTTFGSAGFVDISMMDSLRNNVIKEPGILLLKPMRVIKPFER